MHALALVVIPADGDPQEHVDKALVPWCEEASERGWWDWYQIGGRFTGIFDGYEPSLDPRNIETCSTCGGTGQRDWSDCENVTPEWIAQCNGCNGCNGTGMRVAWPTSWAEHPGDVVGVPVALAHVIEHKTVGYTLVAGETVLHREDCEAFDTEVRKILETADPTWRVVAVDYHS